jgi:hypothetical protein
VKEQRSQFDLLDHLGIEVLPRRVEGPSIAQINEFGLNGLTSSSSAPSGEYCPTIDLSICRHYYKS